MQIADLPSLALCTMHLMSQPWKQFREITTPWKITWPKWNHLWYRWKQDDYFGFQHGRRSRKRIIEQVYGLNIEGWAREILMDYNLILLIMSYPINSAREYKLGWIFRARFTWEYEICIFDSLSSSLPLHD